MTLTAWEGRPITFEMVVRTKWGDRQDVHTVQAVLATIKAGNHSPSLHRHRRLPGKMERLLQHQISFRERPVGVASAELPVEDDIVLHPGVDYSRIRGEALLDIIHYRQGLVFDHHRLGHVLGGMRCIGSDGNDGISHEGNLARRHREPVVGTCEIAGTGGRRPDGVNVGQDLVGGDERRWRPGRSGLRRHL